MVPSDTGINDSLPAGGQTAPAIVNNEGMIKASDISSDQADEIFTTEDVLWLKAWLAMHWSEVASRDGRFDALGPPPFLQRAAVAPAK